MSDAFLKRPASLKYWLLCPFSTRKSQAKAVPRKDYFTRLRSPAKSTSCVSAWILCSDVMSWAQTSRNLLQRILKQGRPALLYWANQEESNGMRSSAKSAWELPRSCHRTSNNQPYFTSLEIPWGFFTWALLRYLAGAHVTREYESLRIFVSKKRYDAQLPDRRLHVKPLEKGGKGKENW
jgi:hypothetical protein